MSYGPLPFGFEPLDIRLTTSNPDANLKDLNRLYVLEFISGVVDGSPGAVVIVELRGLSEPHILRIAATTVGGTKAAVFNQPVMIYLRGANNLSIHQENADEVHIFGYSVRY